MENKLKKYWKFFSERTFPQKTNVEFFNDGSFAICTKEMIDYYNSDCVHVNSLKGQDLRILTNGVTIAIENEEIILARNGKNYCDNFVSLPIEKDTRVLTAGSFILAKKKGSERYQLFLVSDCEITPTAYSGNSTPITFEASDDSKTFAITFKSECAKENCLLCINMHQTSVSKDCIRIDVLGCGSYIEHRHDGSTLYNAYGETVCTSDDTWGITPIGHQHVCFEKKFIVDAINGQIIADANKDITIVHPLNLMFGAYQFCGPIGNYGRMLNGRVLQFSSTSRLDENLVVVYQQGTFYPFLYGTRVSPTDCNDIYRLRIDALYS